MRRERIFLFLGIWVAILPYLGFPYSWKNILFTLSGLSLIYLSYIMRKENKAQEESAKKEEAKENLPEDTNTIHT